ncbi:MAG TPA: methyltransferase domain-containing protein [Vicinamibacteria bacterium]|nr:methyltransferase domain-containing protein [Vicinamibacteria bacterium]
MLAIPKTPSVDRETLRAAIRDEYQMVAREPERGFHFHTGRKLAGILGYGDALLEGIPERAIESFAGTGNPFSLGELEPGERVVDVGCGAGMDSLIAARMVGPHGAVVGIDMTPEMVEKAEAARKEADLPNVEFRRGYVEELPVPDGWADAIISNGVFNLTPDKMRTLKEMARVLKPGGRLQLGDILVEKPVSEKAKERIDLWTG